MPEHDPLGHINLDDLTPEQRDELLERIRHSGANHAPVADLTEILCVLDRSGSMAAMQAEAIGGFNHFLEEQRKLPGRALLTLILFDHEYDVLHAARPIGSVPPMDTGTYVPRGTTALHDAVGRTIDDAVARQARLSDGDRPDKTVMCILTDGLENASRDYSGERIREMIRARRREGWEFVFLAADQDAVTTARAMAIPRADAAAFARTPDGTFAALHDLSARVAEKRGFRR